MKNYDKNLIGSLDVILHFLVLVQVQPIHIVYFYIEVSFSSPKRQETLSCITDKIKLFSIVSIIKNKLLFQ